MHYKLIARKKEPISCSATHIGGYCVSCSATVYNFVRNPLKKFVISDSNYVLSMILYDFFNYKSIEFGIIHIPTK